MDGIAKDQLLTKGSIVAKYGPTYITDLIDRSYSLGPEYVYPFMWDKKHSIKEFKSNLPQLRCSLVEYKLEITNHKYKFILYEK